MKKLILVFLLFLSSSLSLFAAKVDEISQPIAGFIKSADFCSLEITNFFTTGDSISPGPEVNGVTYRGINLDTGASNTSNDKNLIKPSETLAMGKRIGTFNLKASKHDYTLIITHDKLKKQNGTSYEYQLGISFSINGREEMYACCSVGSTGSAELGRSGDVTINFSQSKYGDGVLIVQDAGIFFRLVDTVNDPGQYTSTVTFIVEANST